MNVRGWLNHGDREAYNTRAALGRVFHKMFYRRPFPGRLRGLPADLAGQTMIVGLDYAHLGDDGDKNLADDFRAPFRNASYVSTKNLEFYAMDDIRLLDGKLSISARPPLHRPTTGVAGPSGVVEGIPVLKRSRPRAFAHACRTRSAGRAGSTSAPPGPCACPPRPSTSGITILTPASDTKGLPFREEDGLLIQGGWRALLPAAPRSRSLPTPISSASSSSST